MLFRYFRFLADGFWFLLLFSAWTIHNDFGRHATAFYFAGMLILIVWRLAHGWIRTRKSHPLLG